MARVLVTGGCGFIGSHLCQALVSRGDRVRVLDDLSTGLEENLMPGAELIVADVGDPDALARAMEGMEVCFHLAAVASVERGVRDPRGTHRVNLSATVGVFDEARERGVTVVYASSAAVYGDLDVLPIVEDAPTRPLSAYGADKLGCEQHARVAGVAHGVRTAGFRFFNVFGPRQDPRSPYSGVISIFCERLSHGQPVTIFGDGGQTRDFVAVGDVVAALLAGERVASRGAPVFNVCTGRSTSVLELAGTIAEVCGVRADIRFEVARSGEIRRSLGSRARGRDVLGLAEPRALRAGLEDVIAWMRAGRPGLRVREEVGVSR
ncbi:NAD-dependent epimerase/dehydratase family protein [Roseomonas sp. CCTCC AB2023176]|uniref:NAD-dependent epimerase/dehydratase family protein n=1 Tax=Roseomonas sp. CCTCC AB2023176 TaxID=3342640 RepID=UPI0035DAE58F